MFDELGPPEAAVAREIEEASLHGGVEPRERLRSSTRGVLDEDERAIKDTLLRMGSLIEVAILDTVAALEEHDAAKALSVVEGDARVNGLMREVVDRILVTIATQQPVARDLRFLLTLDHVAYELERIGDNAANVAKRVRELAPQAPLEGHIGLAEMGRLAADILADVARALVDSDAELARTVAARDDLIDRHYHRAQADLARLAKADPANVDRAALLLLCAHYLERIGDRVTNIAEDVVFLSTGLVEDLNP